MKMKSILTIIAAAWLVLSAGAQSAAQDLTSRTHRLREVVVTAKRPLKETGVQRTTFDSLALKENIALSMADILTFRSPVFVKSYGRATLSTVAFRGTSPSHTQVTWNGMKINSPMLGMTDFSTIPSYFIDNASLLHGTSSVNETGGGLGGAVKLGTSPDMSEGFKAQYIQGVGSFGTYDEFLRLAYGGERWKVSTRAVYSSSPNDYEYINRDKKINIYDEERNIIGQYYPKEKNRSGSFKDLHILQEAYYDNRKGDRIGLNAWFMSSDRELPVLTTEYGDTREFENRQRENTFRGVASWDRLGEKWKAGLKGGYIRTDMAYDYKREISEGNWATMTRSRSKINTFYGEADAEYSPGRRWYLTASLSAHQHFVRSEDKNIILQDGDKAIVGYDKGRIELSGAVSAKWRPVERVGVSVVLREELSGEKFAPLIPAFFVDGVISEKGNITLKGSVSENYRFPTLNDLYFLPGGNPDLKNEKGVSYDLGASFDIGKSESFALGGSVTWFDSYIRDWIIWLPTVKGFFSPRNMKKVNAYGVEAKSDLSVRLGSVIAEVNASYSWTPSINRGKKISPADQSVGKQLPYVPRHSATLAGQVSWRSWSFLYKWTYYSERFTMSSNDYTLTGRLPKYYMSNVTLEKRVSLKPADIQLKLAVNNLFDEDYLSVLSRPMPGINFELFIGITPKFLQYGRSR